MSKWTINTAKTALHRSLLLMLVLPVAAGCKCGDPEDQSRSSGAGDRGEPADTVHLAAAWPWADRPSGDYRLGIEFASEQVNREGGISGKPVGIDFIDDGETLRSGKLVAQQIVASGRYAAVIGHLHSHVSLAAAPVYEAAGILMVTPASTAPALTRRGYRLVFRTISSDDVTAERLVHLSKTRRARRIGLCYVRTDYGTGLANAFERRAVEAGLEVVSRTAYEPGSRSTLYYQDIFRDWLDLDLDLVVLAGTAPEAAHILRSMRDSGLLVPVIGGDGLDVADLPGEAGSAADGLEVVTAFHPDNPRPSVQRFVRGFHARFGRTPDSWAARGYEATRVLCEAMRLADAVSGDAVAGVLRQHRMKSMLHGSTRFTAMGDPLERPGILVSARGSGFTFLRETSGADAVRGDSADSPVSSDD